MPPTSEYKPHVCLCPHTGTCTQLKIIMSFYNVKEVMDKMTTVIYASDSNFLEPLTTAGPGFLNVKYVCSLGICFGTMEPLQGDFTHRPSLATP